MPAAKARWPRPGGRAVSFVVTAGIVAAAIAIPVSPGPPGGS
jgi:hypothetical protein